MMFVIFEKEMQYVYIHVFTNAAFVGLCPTPNSECLLACSVDRDLCERKNCQTTIAVERWYIEKIRPAFADAVPL